jgi:uncharacterized protein (TIGR02300 family)
MPKEEWGTKRLCPTTGKRFYDLGRSPVVSPYTGEVVDIDQVRRKVAVAAPIAGKAKPPVDDDLDADDLVEAEADDDTDLDEELLEDDADDSVSLDELTDVAGEDD